MTDNTKKIYQRYIEGLNDFQLKAEYETVKIQAELIEDEPIVPGSGLLMVMCENEIKRRVK